MSFPHGGGHLRFATSSELLLLRSALCEKNLAARAFRQWLTDRREGVFDHLESGSRRLLPLVYRNLKDCLSESTSNQLRQVYLEYWCKNQQIFRRLEEYLAWFESRGIPTMVLKGAALSVLHYRDSAVRPMSDFDVLVPEDQALDILANMQREGWISFYISPRWTQYQYVLRHVHGLGLRHRERGEFDLHWHALMEATFPGADRAFWEGSVPLPLNGITTRTLNPTDQLLHACVHGYRANRDVAPIRWIADACTVMRCSPIDWNRLVQVSRELHLTIPVSHTLAFLEAEFRAGVPEQIIAELAAVPVRRSERRYFERARNLERKNWQEIVADNVEQHRRANRGVPLASRIATLPRQFQLHYNLPRLRNIGPFAMSRMSRRLTRILGQT